MIYVVLISVFYLMLLCLNAHFRACSHAQRNTRNVRGVFDGIFQRVCDEELMLFLDLFVIWFLRLICSVQWLVIDESDKLFEDGETGFRDQVGESLSTL